MLTRRHIRIKVMQALYGFYQTDDSGRDQAKSLTQLKSSLDKIYSLYLYELKTLTLILRAAEQRIDNNKQKQLASREDLNPNLRFVENVVLREFADNKALGKEFELNTINWSEHREVFSRIFKELTQTEEYQKYMLSPKGIGEDKRLVRFIYGTYISENESLHDIYEEMNLHWADDLDAAQMMVVKTIKVMMNINETVVSKVNFKAEEAEKIFESKNLPSDFITADQRITVNLFKDSADKKFGPELFVKTLNKSTAQDELITEKTKNWEADRIAIVDNVLMKMAQTELTDFNEIPKRVTLNEYIELSKMYSTPKSSQFINGVLDKIAAALEDKGEIKKIGRGLM